MSFRQNQGPAPGNTGSGVIVRSDGLIVTNAHVVHGANEVTVTMDDGSKHRGLVTSIDQVCDLATIKIQGVSLKSYFSDRLFFT